MGGGHASSPRKTAGSWIYIYTYTVHGCGKTYETQNNTVISTATEDRRPAQSIVFNSSTLSHAPTGVDMITRIDRRRIVSSSGGNQMSHTAGLLGYRSSRIVSSPVGPDPDREKRGRSEDVCGGDVAGNGLYECRRMQLA